MTDEERQVLLRIVRGSDVSEVMAVVMNGGNRYSRRILRFFKKPTHKQTNIQTNKEKKQTVQILSLPYRTFCLPL